MMKNSSDSLKKNMTVNEVYQNLKNAHKMEYSNISAKTENNAALIKSDGKSMFSPEHTFKQKNAQ